MFGLFAKMFGSEKALEGIVSGVTRGIDALVYTEEEKAIDAAKARSEARAMVVNWMTATSGQNLARRLLAVLITAVWLFQYLLAMIFSLTAVWLDETYAERLGESAALVGGYAEQMNGAMMLILGFYFAAPHMEAIVGTALNKFGGGKK